MNRAQRRLNRKPEARLAVLRFKYSLIRHYADLRNDTTIKKHLNRWLTYILNPNIPGAQAAHAEFLAYYSELHAEISAVVKESSPEAPQ
jgi:hypothetical protein